VSRLYLSAVALAGVAAALLVAACGGTTRPGVSGESGASLVHSGALAYVAVDSDLDSSQWQKVDGLLHKFPSHDKWIRALKRFVAEHEIDYDRDVKPALGPEVDVAAVADGGQQPAWAALTKPESLDKARELVRKLDRGGDHHSVSRVVNGWLAVSESERMLDRVLKGSVGESLADDATFKAAMAELPSDALAKAYVNGRNLGDFVDTLFGSGARTAAVGSLVASPFDKLDWIAAAALAKGDGIRVEAGIKGAGGSKLVGGGSYRSKLISGVPADALGLVDFRGGNLGELMQQARQNPVFGQALDELETELGMRLDAVLGLFAHEVAFYVRKGPGLPEFSLALETPDTEAALTTIDRLAGRAAKLLHARLGEDREDGLPVKTFTVGPVTIRWAGFNGRVLLTTGPTGISDYRASGDKLADDADYKHALSAAGAPDQTAGLIYVDLHDTVQLVEDYLGLSGDKIPAEVSANLKPLRSFVAYASTSGDLTELVAFLEIK
jgi:hypothetical protein